MKSKTINALDLKQQLQEQAQKKLSALSEKEQLELLRRKFGHLTQQKKSPKPLRRTVIRSH
jgi:hypothetical protein